MNHHIIMPTSADSERLVRVEVALGPGLRRSGQTENSDAVGGHDGRSLVSHRRSLIRNRVLGCCADSE
jgi:hypothetical protein